MRVLHAAALLTPPSGIIRQMEWEQEAARELRLTWDVRMYCPAGTAGSSSTVCVVSNAIADTVRARSGLAKFRRWILHRRAYARWIRNVADDYDVLVLRYYVHDPFQWLLVKSVRKPVFFVHHTKEVDELALTNGLGGKVRSTLEALIGAHSIRSAFGLIAVTREIFAYENCRAYKGFRAEIIYPNGIKTGECPAGDLRPSVVEMLFVASEFYPWHGLDLLLDAVMRTSQSFVLHLVGHLSDEDRNRAEQDGRIKIHGHLCEEQIREVAAHCHIGLSSFALQRKGMLEACTLKVRECLDMGLPVYAGHKDVFPNDFPFYRIGGADVRKIIAFAHECENSSRQMIAESARQYIDKKALLAKLYSDIAHAVVK